MTTAVRHYHAYRDLTDDERAEMANLIRSLGFDPDDVSVRFAVAAGPYGVRLHLTADEPVSTPRVFDVDPALLPASVRPAEPFIPRSGVPRERALELAADQRRSAPMTDETRFVLLKPGDVLLIGNAPSFGPEDLEMLSKVLLKPMGIHAVVLEDDITIDRLTAEDLTRLTERGRTDDH